MKRRNAIKVTTLAGVSSILGQGCSTLFNKSQSSLSGSDRRNFKSHPETVIGTEKAGGTSPKLLIATCQFPVESNIEDNCGHILRQMRIAKKAGADIVHFSETCLGGYAGVDFDSFDHYDWDLLRQNTRRIMELSGELRLWVILGSNHALTGKHKPHNSLYIINDDGDIVDRYDKMFCTGNREETTGDLKHYSPGSQFIVFTIKGITCGLLICHDMRYQELYREYKKRGVQLMFHSYYNGKMKFKNPDDPDENIWGVITEPTMQTYAANNHMWISVNNTSGRESCWPGFFVRPDGVITGRLTRNEEGVLISVFDTTVKYYDPSEAWRERAMNGVYNSGTLVNDERSGNRNSL